MKRLIVWAFALGSLIALFTVIVITMFLIDIATAMSQGLPQGVYTHIVADMPVLVAFSILWVLCSVLSIGLAHFALVEHVADRRNKEAEAASRTHRRVMDGLSERDLKAIGYPHK